MLADCGAHSFLMRAILSELGHGELIFSTHTCTPDIISAAQEMGDLGDGNGTHAHTHTHARTHAHTHSRVPLT